MEKVFSRRQSPMLLLRIPLGFAGPQAVVESTCALELRNGRLGAACRKTYCSAESSLPAGHRPNSTALQGGRGRRAQAVTARDALWALYESAGGRNWKDNSGWNNTEPCRGGPPWFGVTCEGPDVVSLSFLPPGLEFNVAFGSRSDYADSVFSKARELLETTANNLVGTLPTELFGLTALTKSSMLQYNGQLSGTIPTEAGQLSKLSGQFGILGSKISGWLPSQVGRLSGLTKGLLLSFNSLSGTIPTDIARIQKLLQYSGVDFAWQPHEDARHNDAKAGYAPLWIEGAALLSLALALLAIWCFLGLCLTRGGVGRGTALSRWQSSSTAVYSLRLSCRVPHPLAPLVLLLAMLPLSTAQSPAWQVVTTGKWCFNQAVRVLQTLNGVYSR